MAHNPHAPAPGPSEQDPAGSTQMFQAFVNDDATTRQPAPTGATTASGPRVGLIVGVVLAVVAVAAVAWLALG